MTKPVEKTRFGRPAAFLAAAALASATLLPAWAEETRGPTTYDVEKLAIEDFIGTIEIDVTSGGSTTLTMSGEAEELDKLEVEERGDRLVIKGEKGKIDWNDWSGWFSWSSDGRKLEDYPRLVISMPEGTDLHVEDSAGKLTVGDLGGAVRLKSVSLEAQIGDVTAAEIGVSGSGEIDLGEVEGDLKIAISGSGDVSVESAGGAASVAISGNGDVSAGTIGAGLQIAVSGSGDAAFESANGPVSIVINGSGDIDVGAGRADPLAISISGSGDVTFGGVAVDPTISISGSGDVVLQSYEGSLRSTGSGSGDVTVRSSN